METTTISLKDIAQRKLDAKLTRGAISAQHAVERLTAEGKISRDFIAPLGVILRDAPPVVTFQSNGHMYMDVRGEQQFDLHPHAVGQVADKLGIPRGYLNPLANGTEWEKALAAHTMNEFSAHTQRNRVLVRAVGNEVRGVLSDSYRRLNSLDIVSAFLTAGVDRGAIVSDGWMDDTRMRFEIVLPHLIDVPTAGNGMVHLIVGAVLKTSDFGDSSLTLNAYVMQAVCLNGMVRERNLRAVHLGARLPENLALSERTYQLETQTQASAVNDATRFLFDRERIMRSATEVQIAAETTVDMDAEVKKLVAKNLITKGEATGVQQVLMRNNADEDGVQGDSTLWKLTQAITAVARDTAPRRTDELQEIAGELMKRVTENKAI